MAASTATIAIGMFTNRHHRQDAYSVNTPPSSSPTAAPPPEIAPKTAKALARSLAAWNVTVTKDSAAGASIAAKAPWNARATNSCQPTCAAPPIAEAMAKPDSEMIRIFLRPT